MESGYRMRYAVPTMEYSSAIARFPCEQISDGTSKTFIAGERDRYCLTATWIGARNPHGPGYVEFPNGSTESLHSS